MQCALAGLSANIPIQCVLKGNFVSMGCAGTNGEIGVGFGPLSEQLPGAIASRPLDASITLEPPAAPESDAPPVPDPPVPLAVLLVAASPVPVPAVLAPPAPLLVPSPPAPLAVVLDVGVPLVLDAVPVPALVVPDAPDAGVEPSLPQATRANEPKIQARRVRIMAYLPSCKFKVQRSDPTCTLTGSKPPRMTGRVHRLMAGQPVCRPGFRS
jgi:hypothetical protein